MSQKHDADNIIVITTKNYISRPHATFLQKSPGVSISNPSQGRYPWNPWNQKTRIYSPQGFQANPLKGQIFPHMMMSRGNTVRINWSSRTFDQANTAHLLATSTALSKRQGKKKFGAQSFPSFLLRRKKLSRFQLPSNVSSIKYSNTLSYSWQLKVQANGRS